jgi:hypothetical protein
MPKYSCHAFTSSASCCSTRPASRRTSRAPNPRLVASRTGTNQNFASFRSGATCTCGGSARSLEKKKNRYGPLSRMVGLTWADLASFQMELPPVSLLRLTRALARRRSRYHPRRSGRAPCSECSSGIVVNTATTPGPPTSWFATEGIIVGGTARCKCFCDVRFRGPNANGSAARKAAGGLTQARPWLPGPRHSPGSRATGIVGLHGPGRLT